LDDKAPITANIVESATQIIMAKLAQHPIKGPGYDQIRSEVFELYLNTDSKEAQDLVAEWQKNEVNMGSLR
jgi:hypothetical protein